MYHKNKMPPSLEFFYVARMSSECNKVQPAKGITKNNFSLHLLVYLHKDSYINISALISIVLLHVYQYNDKTSLILQNRVKHCDCCGVAIYYA